VELKLTIVVGWEAR